jgi:hypothetical protein
MTYIVMSWLEEELSPAVVDMMCCFYILRVLVNATMVMRTGTTRYQGRKVVETRSRSARHRSARVGGGSFRHGSLAWLDNDRIRVITE